MPTLPTFEVTSGTATRLLAAFSGEVNEEGVPLTPVQAYRRWLRTMLIDRVLRHEAQQENTLEQEMPL